MNQGFLGAPDVRPMIRVVKLRGHQAMRRVVWPRFDVGASLGCVRNRVGGDDFQETKLFKTGLTIKKPWLFPAKSAQRFVFCPAHRISTLMGFNRRGLKPATGGVYLWAKINRYHPILRARNFSTLKGIPL
jgi:hypothetical protein